MHEVSIAQSILKIVEDILEKEEGSNVSELIVDVGRLSGVVHDSLCFAMDMVKKKTILEKTNIILNDIPGKARCLDCQTEFELEMIYQECPKCKEFNITLIQGKELKVRSISVDN